MSGKRDYDKELVEKGVMVYDSKDKCYYIADGYTADDVYDYINPKTKPKKILEKIKVLNDLKFDADNFTRSAAKIMSVSRESVRDRRRLGDLLITYEKGDCTEEEKKELTQLYNKLKKSHIKLIKNQYGKFKGITNFFSHFASNPFISHTFYFLKPFK